MPLLSPGKRVVILGDSHMEGLGPRLRTRLQAAGVAVQHVEPRRGWSARRYAATGITLLTRGADVVIIELGGNDAIQGIGAGQHERDVTALVNQAAPASVIWVGPAVTSLPELEAAEAPLRAVQARVVPRLGGAWLDGRPMTQASDLSPDRMHFRMSGYTRWADRLTSALARADAGQADSEGPLWLGPVILAASAALAFGAWAWSRR